MAKIQALVAVMVLLLAISEAKTYDQQQCSLQIESQGQDLSHCEMYLSMKIMSSFKRKQQLLQCCQEMQSFDPECSFKAAMEAFRRQMEEELEESGGWVEESQMHKAMEMATSLPRSCSIQSQECHLPLEVF